MATERTTLAHAYLRAGRALGLTMDELGTIVDHDIEMIRRDGLDPDTPAGFRALLLIRLYTRLYALLGGASEDLKHWMKTPNRAIGDIPAERIKSLSGLLRLTEYLDAI